MMFFFFMTVSLERLLLRPFLNEVLPKMLSKSMIPHETSLKKSKKRQAIAPALGELLEVPGELWEGLGDAVPPGGVWGG